MGTLNYSTFDTPLPFENLLTSIDLAVNDLPPVEEAPEADRLPEGLFASSLLGPFDVPFLDTGLRVFPASLPDLGGTERVEAITRTRNPREAMVHDLIHQVMRRPESRAHRADGPPRSRRTRTAQASEAPRRVDRSSTAGASVDAVDAAMLIARKANSTSIGWDAYDLLAHPELLDSVIAGLSGDDHAEAVYAASVLRRSMRILEVSQVA